MSDTYKLARSGRLTESKLDEFLQSSKIDAENSQNRTLLLEAIKGGHLSTVELLIKKGTNVNKRGIHGRTPLNWAIGAKENRVKTIGALIDAKADPDLADDDGNTPLMDAIIRRADVTVVKLLVDSGASTTKQNRDRMSAMGLAKAQKDHNITRALLPADEHAPGRLEFIDLLVNVVLFILAYVNSGAIKGVVKGVISNLYHIVGNSEPDSTIARAIEAPETVDDSKKNNEPDSKIAKAIETRETVNNFKKNSEPDSTIAKKSKTTETVDDFKKNSESDSSKIAKKVKPPMTVGDFKKNIENFVVNKNPELSSFFAPGNDFFQKVAEKAVQLKEDPRNPLRSPDQINDLTRLALYQPILYCDDSGSMGTADTTNGPSRQELLRRLVTRMCSVATRLVPDGEGVHLRFINKNPPRAGAYDSLSKDQINDALNFRPNGGTPISKELRKRILKPFVFDVFARGETLKRPILIIIITDGCPTNETPDNFKQAIVECGQALEKNNYGAEACRFLVSRVGKDEAAIEFLEALGGDIAIDRVVHRTSDQLDAKFGELQKNEKHVEEWLLNLLISPITTRSLH